MAPFEALNTGTVISLRARGAEVKCVAMYHRTHVNKAPGIGTMSEANGPGAVAPGARMPGRANGSILSLVNRAVNSNIFMRD